MPGASLPQLLAAGSPSPWPPPTQSSVTLSPAPLGTDPSLLSAEIHPPSTPQGQLLSVFQRNSSLTGLFLETAAVDGMSRGSAAVSASITNNPKTQWHQTTTIYYYFPVPVDQEFRSSLAGWF